MTAWMTVWLVFTMTGCINEPNLDKCPIEVTLTFDYFENGADLFGRDINSVDVFVFDANGVFLWTQNIRKSELNQFQGLHLTLPPGDYQVVAWANITNHSIFSGFVPGVTTINDCYVQIASQDTGDPLFFAPGNGNGQIADNSLHVKPQETTTKNMHFVRANRQIKVYIKGIEHTQNGASTAPYVYANNLWNKYNFANEAQSVRTNLIQEAGYAQTPDGRLYLATFYSGLGAITADMEIVVTNALGQEVARINLRDYVAQHPGINTEEIEILITFEMDLGVTITLPGWEDVPTNPEINK
jgi:hypothetical protein